MKGSQAALIGFYRRFAEALQEGEKPSVRVIRKPREYRPCIGREVIIKIDDYPIFGGYMSIHEGKLG